MDVFHPYDSQVAKHMSTSKPMMLPLLSWDVHMDNMCVLTKVYSDIAEIKKLTGRLLVDVDIVSELKENEKIIVITDADLKIEFASANMVGMSGYIPSEVIGQSPKMFQGPATDKEVSKKIRTQVNAQEPFEVTLANYKKNKSVYNCHIKGYPIFDKKGTLVKYVAVEEAA